MESSVVRATKDQIKEFKNSLVWKDIKRELSVWRKLCTQEYSQVVDSAIGPNAGNSSNVLIHLGDVHGRENAINYLLSIPDVFLQILEDQENDTECK